MDDLERAKGRFAEIFGSEHMVGMHIMKGIPASGERLDDPAEWWIRGECQRVLDHLERVAILKGKLESCPNTITRGPQSSPSRPAHRPRRIDRARLLQLVESGLKLKEVAKESKCSLVYVHKVLQSSRANSES